MTLTLLALLSAASQAAPCPRKAELGELRRVLAAGFESYTLGDRPSLEAAARDAERLVPCLANPIAPREAATLHLIEGLLAWDPSVEGAADPFLHAARAADPALQPAELGLSPTDPAVVRWLSLPPDEPSSLLALPPPAKGRLAVDGLMVPQAGADAPYVLQVVRGGAVLAGGYVPPGARPPAYARLRPRLAVAGSALALTSGGLLLAGAATHRTIEQWRDEGQGSVESGELEQTRRQNNTLLVSGLVAGVGAAGVAGALLVVSF